jgi:hypothetical protein
MESEPRPQDGGRRRRATESERAASDTIVIRLPRIEPALRDLFLDMLPGRALLRVLCDPPEQMVAHVRNSRRERLLALRSVIDALIQETERPPASGGRRRAREVPIE